MRAYKPFLLRSAMLALTLSTSCAAMARAEELCAGTAEEKKPIELTAGHVKFFTFAQSFERLAIGNRAILGVQPAGSNVAILLTGLAVGETNLLAIDRFNKKICSAIVRVERDAEDVGKVMVVRGPFVMGRRGVDQGFHPTTLRCAPTCIPVDDSLNKVKRNAPWPGVPEEAGKPGEEKSVDQTVVGQK
jgi:putative type II/III system pilus formation protein